MSIPPWLIFVSPTLFGVLFGIFYQISMRTSPPTKNKFWAALHLIRDHVLIVIFFVEVCALVAMFIGTGWEGFKAAVALTVHWTFSTSFPALFRDFAIALLVGRRHLRAGGWREVKDYVHGLKELAIVTTAAFVLAMACHVLITVPQQLTAPPFHRWPLAPPEAYKRPVVTPRHAVKASPSKTVEAQVDAMMKRLQLIDDGLKNSFKTEFPLGWDLFTVDLSGVTEKDVWIPSDNPNTEFRWLSAGGVRFSDKTVSVSLPQVIIGNMLWMSNVISVPRIDGASCNFNIDPDTPRMVTAVGNTIFCGPAPINNGRNPKFTATLRIQSITDAGVMMVLGLKLYR